MAYRIVTDSSANLLQLEGIDLGVVPLHIIVGDQEFIDNEDVDLTKMQTSLDTYKGKTSTSCPSPEEWLAAFADEEVVFCVTITSALSGSCSSANLAKQMYEAQYPERVVYVIDSLSTGPEMILLLEKLRDLIASGADHIQIHQRICEYQKRTHLLFCLASVDNLARNGRVNPLIAKGMDLLGIKILGKASSEGTLQIMSKCRGNKRAFQYLAEQIRKNGYSGGKIIIAHNNNEAAAEELHRILTEAFGEFQGDVHLTRALCSYYAEPESLLVGFES